MAAWSRTDLDLQRDGAAPFNVVQMPLTTGFGDVLGHTVTAQGSPIIQSVVVATGAGALYLDGASKLRIASSFSTTNAVPWTLETWFNTSDNGGGLSQVLFAAGTRTTGLYLGLTPDGRLEVTSYEGGAPRTHRATTTGLNDGRWHQVALVFTAYTNSRIKIFVDGHLALSDLTSGGITITGGTGALGFDYTDANGAGYAHFRGYLEDLRWTAGVPRYMADFALPTGNLPTQ